MRQPHLDIADIEASLFTSAPTGAHYMDGTTDLYLSTSLTSELGRMVTEHESTHARLNAHTMFGALLRSGAEEDQGKPGSASRLGELVDVARRTHEVAATALGAWSVSPDAEELLAPFPAYRTYLDDALALARGAPEGSFAGVLIVEQICRVAMQGPFLHLVANPARWGEIAPDEIPAPFRPDVRLQAFLDLELDLSGLVSLSKGNRLASEELGEGERRGHGRWYYAQAEWVFNHAAALLLHHTGFPTTSFNGHVREGLALSHRRTRHLTFFEGVSAARVHVRTERRPMAASGLRVRRLGEFSEMMLVIRPLARLLEQYTVSLKTRRVLEAASDDGFVVGLRRQEAPEAEVALTLEVVTDPLQLRQLGAQGVFIPGSVCSSCLHSDWWDRWRESVQAVAGVTILLDSDVDEFQEQLAASIGDDRPSFASGAIEIRLGEAEAIPTAYLYVFEDNKPNNGMLTVAIADMLVVSHIAATWRVRFGGSASEVPFVREALPRLVAVLVECEPWFDLGSLPASLRGEGGA